MTMDWVRPIGQIKEAEEIIGKRIVAVCADSMSDRFSLRFDDKTFLILKGGGYYEGRTVEINDSGLEDGEAVALGFMTPEQGNARHQERVRTSKEQTERMERQTLARLQTKYQPGKPYIP